MKLINILDQIVSEKIQYKQIMYNHSLQDGLMRNVLHEETDLRKRQGILDKIKAGDWETPQNARSFRDSMNRSKHKEMLTPYSAGKLSKMRLFKLNGYSIGFALKKRDGKYNEIVAVHNNEPDIKNIGKELMRAAIDNGGCYLDHFDGYLSQFYQSLGFEEYSRDKFDPQYDEDETFRNKYGEADVIYRKHKNCK